MPAVFGPAAAGPMPAFPRLTTPNLFTSANTAIIGASSHIGRTVFFITKDQMNVSRCYKY
jgi:hypothetical protein